VLKIVGEKFFGIVPDIRVDFNQTVYVGETAIFNASKSTDDGEIVSLEWNFGDGTSGNGAVVSHSYTKEGTYQVVLNVTDNDGLHNLATLTVTARKQPTYVPIVASAVLTTIIGLLIVALIILALKNRTNASSHDC
jgi:PKD repeat protein